MRETLGPPVVEQRPPIAQKVLLQNVLLAHGIAFVVDKAVLGQGLNPDGRKLLRRLVVRTWKGERVSVAKEVSRLLDYSDVSIEVDGEENIPSYGPTVFVTNHIRGGPLRNLGQFFRMVEVGYQARFDVPDDHVREPYVILQRGLAKGWLVQKLSGVFYDIVGGNGLGFEVVAIPKFDKSRDGNGEEILNRQRLKESAIQRIAAGGASLWLPQGRERAPDDFNFPPKGNGYLRKVSAREPYTQMVPICATSDPNGNLKIIFGKPKDIKHVIANGGIEAFAIEHIAPLRQSGL